MSQPSDARGGRWANLALASISIAFVLLGVTCADRWIAAPLMARADYRWYIFEPFSTRVYKYEEFEAKASVNNLGLRGPRTALAKSKTRIAILGDSYTFGWGVNDDETYPAVLEQRLRERGRDVEVLNLGRPGASPWFYVSLAELSFKELQPDLVLLAVLQGDDLASCGPEPGEYDAAGFPVYLMPQTSQTFALLQSRLPGLADVAGYALRRPSHMDAEASVAEERARLDRMVRRMTPEQRARMEALPAPLLETYRAGRLNPSNLRGACENPGFFEFTLHPERDTVKAHLAAMGDALARVRRQAWLVGAPSAIIIVPHAVYVSPAALRSARTQGYASREEMLTSPLPDRLIEDAAAIAKLHAISVTAAFRSDPDVDSLYYPLDLHFTVAGQRKFADAIAPRVEALLDAPDAEGLGRGNAPPV